MNPLNFVAVILKVLLVNLLAALKFDKVFYNKKNVLKIKKTLKNVTEIKKNAKTFFYIYGGFYSAPDTGSSEYCDERVRLSVCVCICLSAIVCPDGWMEQGLTSHSTQITVISETFFPARRTNGYVQQTDRHTNHATSVRIDRIFALHACDAA